MTSSLILCLAVCLACCQVGISSSSSGGGKKQTCRSTAPNTYGRDEFFCPVDQQCKPARQRCLSPSSQVCQNDADVEAGCDYDSASGRYEYFKGRSPLSSLGSSSRRRKRGPERCAELFFDDKLYHEFVDYRGFTYEFGSYGLQVLDKNDPVYKYGPRGDSQITKYDQEGTSDCTYEELKKYVQEYWNGDYDVCDHNCQDFARGLLRLLSSNCAQIRALPQKKKRDASLSPDLAAYFRQITVGNCTVDDDSNSPNGAGTTGMGATWINALVAILATIMSARGL